MLRTVTVTALAIVAALAMALTLGTIVGTAPTPSPVADEAAWRNCVATSEPTDANMRACDAAHGAWTWVQ